MQVVPWIAVLTSLWLALSPAAGDDPRELVVEGPVAQDSAWAPPSRLARAEIVEASNELLARPDLEVVEMEDIFRIEALAMEWDLGAAVFEPVDPSRIPVGADGKKVGIFLLHGGSGDHRSQASIARFLAGKFGFKVVTMSYPGRLYLLDPSRDWPGDTIHPSGTVRTPVWNVDSPITPDQYEVIEDREETRRARWGTLVLACAREGSEFYDRMAGWPAAFEVGARDLMERHFPAGEYSIYLHGHSTGGIFVDMMSQRVQNVSGILGMESSSFGYITAERMQVSWDLPFNCLRIRNWRDTARYLGPEALADEGPDALTRLPLLMERVFERWERGTTSPHFKAENIIHFNAPEALAEAARAAAQRLAMTPEETEDLVRTYVGYTRELEGPGVKPVPPILTGITRTSTDHTIDSYRNVVLPMYAAMSPPPKVSVVEFGAGIHSYSRPEPDLPMGLFPAVALLWHDAIMGGHFLH